MDYGFSNWILLFTSIVVAIVGLLLAGKGIDVGMELAGWLFFIFGVGFSFRLAGKMAVESKEE